MKARFKKPKGWLWGQFNNARGKILRFGTLHTHKTPQAHVVYIEGLSEFAEKTFELAQDFNAMACNFSVIDRYGQGKSSRYDHLGDRQKQHSDGIDHDIDDIIQYCREHIPAGEPIVLLGHSTGGLIALLAMEKAPELFKAAILTAPLLGFENPLLKNREAIYARLPIPGILREKYAPGGGGWAPRGSKGSPNKPEDYSSDPERNKLSDQWPNHLKDLRAGSPTVGWVLEMCKGIMKSQDPAIISKITAPVLIFTAGRDILVNNDPAFAVEKNLPNGELHHYERGKHELLVEKDSIRNDLLQKVQDFMKKHL